MRSAMLSLLLALAVVTGGLTCVSHELHRPVVFTAPEVLFEVEPGASLRSVARELGELGLVRYPELLVAWARLRKLDRSIHSGTHRLRSPVSAADILLVLQQPPAVAGGRVTIPEGHTVQQVAALLERAGFGGQDVFESAMNDPRLQRDLHLPASGFEGYLFPDTYNFPWSIEPAEILRSMVARLREQVTDLERQRRALGWSEVEMITLASIVEKETGRAEERPLIAGVFHNRLRLGMRLQSDPTVIYGLRTFDGNLRRSDLAHPSPYNTYVHGGLPPGPIANPGRAALLAVVDPQRTDALYFVSRNDGSHEFSATLAEHNRAVHRYQKSGRTHRRPGTP